MKKRNSLFIRRCDEFKIPSFDIPETFSRPKGFPEEFSKFSKTALRLSNLSKLFTLKFSGIESSLQIPRSKIVPSNFSEIKFSEIRLPPQIFRN